MRNYEDIRNHERYQLKHHTPMSLESRAAQFAPFAALVGYDEEIGEAARSTDGREELSEDAIDALNQAFQKLLEHEDWQSVHHWKFCACTPCLAACTPVHWGWRAPVLSC